MRYRRTAPLLAAAALAVTGCSVSADPDEVGLEYNAGPLQDTSYSACVPAGTRQRRGPFDKGFLYPAGQRTGEFVAEKGADFRPISVVSADHVTMKVSGVAVFALNTECDMLRRFHEDIGLKYGASADGVENWRGLLRVYLRQPLEKALDAASKKYEYRELYVDPDVKEAWEAEVGRLAAQYVTDTAGADYFCQPTHQPGQPCGDLTLTIQAPQPPQSIIEAYNAVEAARQENVAQAQRNTTAATASAGLVSALRELGMPVTVETLDAYTRWLAVDRGRARVVVLPQDSGVAVRP